MMAENDPLVGGREVPAVVESYCRGRAIVVELEDVRRDYPAVDAIGDDVGADRRGKEPRGVDRLTARKSDSPEAQRADYRNHQQQQLSQSPPHSVSLGRGGEIAFRLSFPQSDM